MIPMFRLSFQNFPRFLRLPYHAKIKKQKSFHEINSRKYSSGDESLLQCNVSKDIVTFKYLGGKYNFPTLWLRDNCQCEKCYHSPSHSRIINWTAFDLQVYPTTVTRNSHSLAIKWSDGHVSEYQNEWLIKRSFKSNHQEEYLTSLFKPQKILWGKMEFGNILKSCDYTALLHSSDKLMEWILNLAIYGVTLITNVPNSDNAVIDLANKLAFIRKTHYGEEFIVQAKSDTSNVAYLSSNLQLHTDLPYYDYAPGVTLLHYLVQTNSEGGDNILADAFYVANRLKYEKPEYYDILSSVLVDWADIGTESEKSFHSITRAPVICLDSNKEIVRINHSVPQRSSYFCTDFKNVKPWYFAMKHFVDLIHEEGSIFKITAEQILAFDNMRLVHGRKAYNDSSSNSRKLIGVYIDWDELYSKVRSLKIER